ncbi:MAG: penicillin-binding protein 2 [Terrimicrobiaceae bacterium]|nr:penicillin-binding protein 2 [Terrimicrobiaceae bacterium]
MKLLLRLAFFSGLVAVATGQEAVLDNSGTVENPKPTWETQKQARTWQLGIPAPRGLITDRNGKPFAQSRMSYNLAISFPTPLDFTDKQVIEFARQQVTLAKGLLGREIGLNEKSVLDHYKNRGVLPYDIAEDLKPQELAVVAKGVTPTLILRQTYVRFYPEGPLAGGIVGYVGRQAPLSLRPIENGDVIFPNSEGREGLEQIYDNELRGQPGLLHVTFDENGRKTSERIARPPVPGYNVITTLDRDLQALCENVLSKNAKRGAIVLIDPNTGEILALASWPTFDPNMFVPFVNQQAFDAVQKDPAVPLLPRAYRSAYPPGSTFKTFVGLSGFEEGKLKPGTEFGCPTALSIGNFVFHNWKKNDAGSLNFVEALTQSCNTWFIQAGLKMGSKSIINWTGRLGLGQRTGLPLKAEERGNIPNDTYMLRVQKRKILQGDLANMSIGQGDILITPLQMAQAYGVISSGGQFHQSRLVMQIQSLDNKVVAAYPDRVRDDLAIKPEIMDQLRKALVAVTENGNGTAHKAQVEGIHVAGKTGTAQWGPKEKQRTAAWFAGFAPAENPRYAFAAVYEGEPGDNGIHGGSHAAPLIGKVLKSIFAPDKGGEEKSEKEETDESN